MGYLAGSRALLSQYLQAHPASRTEGVAVEQEREELRAALVTAQESAAIQILLEVCVKTPQDQVCFQTTSFVIVYLAALRTSKLGAKTVWKHEKLKFWLIYKASSFRINCFLSLKPNAPSFGTSPRGKESLMLST